MADVKSAGPFSESTTVEPALNPDQRGRVEALKAARYCLGKTGSGGILSTASSDFPTERDVTDLIDVARYIERGEHPLDDKAHAAPRSWDGNALA